MRAEGKNDAAIARVMGVSRQRIWQLRRSAEGQCQECAAPTEAGLCKCVKCRAKEVAVREGKIARGKCGCGGRLSKGYRTCGKCRAATAKYMRERIAAGLCSACGTQC